jgi:hypothetical protein
MFATTLNAFKSSQLSISSKIIYFGSTSFICKISIFLFSHPENPTFKSLSKKFSVMSNSSKYFQMYFLKTNGEIPLAVGFLFFK